jgi:hypothetical protein
VEELFLWGGAPQLIKTCRMTGCKMPVPSQIESEEHCLLHFTLKLEQKCAELRRETVSGHSTAERSAEIIHFISDQGELLARVSTSGMHMADELKARVLSTFLTLMNLRESLDRAALRMPAGRTVLRQG